MTKSHKLLLAAALLAGGYGIALLLGSLSSWIVPQSADRAVASSAGGALEPMNSGEFAAAPLSPRPVPMQVSPQVSTAVSPTTPATDTSPLPAPPLDAPTWLAASPEPVAPSSFAGADGPRNPLAKVTDVNPWGATTASDAPSPWDRWPAWDPGASAAGTAANSAPVGAANARSSAIQASYHPSDDQRWDNNGTASDDLRTHIVVDGDSLAKLADRYLDDPQLADEIYELNRGVLTSPELLPIGVELRIPERRMASASWSQLPSRSADVSTPHAPNRFEPVESWLDRANDVPRAQLLQPVPVGRDD